MEFLKKLFGGGEDTVDSIISDFRAKVARLNAVAQKHIDNANLKHAEAKKATDEAEGHSYDASRAQRIAKKIDDLVSGE